MTFYKITLEDKRSHVVTGLTVAQLKILANALGLDIAGDNAAGVNDPGKVEALEKIKALIPE